VVGTRQHEEKDAYRGGHVLGNRLFTGLLARLFGRSFTDVFSGYRVFSRRFVKSFPVLSAGFETETEMSVHALELRMPVGEVETAYGSRLEGAESKLSTLGHGWRSPHHNGLPYPLLPPAPFLGPVPFDRELQYFPEPQERGLRQNRDRRAHDVLSAGRVARVAAGLKAVKPSAPPEEPDGGHQPTRVISTLV